MGPNIPNDDINFLHRMVKKFTIDFIVLINQFEPRKEITFIKDGSRAIILITVPNSLNKMTFFKTIINVFTILIAKIACVCNL